MTKRSKAELLTDLMQLRIELLEQEVVQRAKSYDRALAGICEKLAKLAHRELVKESS